MISAPAHPLGPNELAWERLIDAPFATKQPVEPGIGCIDLVAGVTSTINACKPHATNHALNMNFLYKIYPL